MSDTYGVFGDFLMDTNEHTIQTNYTQINMRKIFTLFLTMCTIGACTQFEEPTTKNERTTPRTRSGGDTPTFDTLPNPFTLDVMQEILRV